MEIQICRYNKQYHTLMYVVGIYINICINMLDYIFVLHKYIAAAVEQIVYAKEYQINDTFYP